MALDEAFHLRRIVTRNPARGLVRYRLESRRNLVLGGHATRQNLKLQMADNAHDPLRAKHRPEHLRHTLLGQIKQERRPERLRQRREAERCPRRGGKTVLDVGQAKPLRPDQLLVVDDSRRHPRDHQGLAEPLEVTREMFEPLRVLAPDPARAERRE